MVETSLKTTHANVYMLNFLRNIRAILLGVSIVLALGIYAGFKAVIPESTLFIIRLTQVYALVALVYVYVAILIGPAVYKFTWIPGRGHIYRARRAIGVSGFGFALLHASLAFWGQLGGFSGLSFLPLTYLVAISLSFVALIILALMAGTSFDALVTRLGFRRWKFLHRFVYVAGVLIVIHALMLGSHFTDLSATIPKIFIVALVFLLLLQGIRFNAYLARRWGWHLCLVGLATLGTVLPVTAHVAGVPFFMMNGKLALTYPVPGLPVEGFDVPQDLAPEVYVVGQEVVAVIDTVALQVPPEVLKETRLSWDWGDGSATVYGWQNRHTYMKEGSYIIRVSVGQGDTFRSREFESVMVHVRALKDDALPQASFTVNGEFQKDPVNDATLLFLPGTELEFEASMSQAGKTPIATYIWNFGDDSPLQEGEKVTHTYTDGRPVAGPMVRVVSENGFISDAYAQLEFSDKAERKVRLPSFQRGIVPFWQTSSDQPVWKRPWVYRSVAGVVILLVIGGYYWWRRKDSNRSLVKK